MAKVVDPEVTVRSPKIYLDAANRHSFRKIKIF